MKGFVLLSLFFLVNAEDSVDCPDFLLGYNYNSEENDERTYWHCPDSINDNTVVQSVKNECDEGAIYDARIGGCKSGTSQRDVKTVDRLEIEALTDAQKLGALYNARTHTFPGSSYLWDVSEGGVVEQSKITHSNEYSNLDIFQENNLQDRVDKLSIDQDLAIKFLLDKDLVNFGTVSYLKDDKTSTNTARVVMSYRSTREVESLPLSTPITYPASCKAAELGDGVTHALTGIVRGLRALLTFDKETSKDETVEKIGAKLLADVNLVPSFVKTASAWVDGDGKEVKDITNLKVKYYGDTPIDTPSDYESALQAFSNIEESAQNSTAPVRYVLTPLSFLCEGHTARLHTVNEQLLNRAVDILTEIQEGEERLSALVESQAAETVPSLKDRLLLYKESLQDYEAKIARDIGEKIQKIKKGEGAEGELVRVLQQHDESDYSSDTMSSHLDKQSKEVAAITLIIDELDKHNQAKGKEIFALKDQTNKDLSCIINSDHATKYEFVFKLKVLRPGSATQTTQEDDSGLWYNDLTKVGAIGAKLKAFLAFGSASWTEDTTTDQHCFLIELVEVDPEDSDFVSISYHYKDHRHSQSTRQGDDFIPPAAPPKPVCTPSYDSFHISTSSSSNEFVKAHWVVASSTGQGDVVSRDNPVAADDLIINGLQMNTAYDVTTKYKVLDAEEYYFYDLGFSPSSEPTLCITAPSSEVRDLRIAAATHTTLSVSWTKPLVSAQDADIRYIIKVKESGESDDKGLIINLGFEEVSKVVSGLVPATIYDVIMFTQTNVSRSSLSEISMTTAPGKIEYPQVKEVHTVGSTYIKMTGKVNLVQQQLNKAMTSPKLQVEYMELGDEIGKGDKKTILLEITSGEDITFFIRDLSLGKDYEITFALLVNVKDTSLQLTSPRTDTLTVSIPIKGTEVERARYNLDAVKGRTDANLQDLSEGVSKVARPIRDLTRDVASYLEETRQELGEFVIQEEIFSDTLKKSCIEVGWEYSSESGQLDSTDDVNSIYQCLNHCRETEGCNSVSWDKVGTRCATFKERVGGKRTASANSWTANKACYDTMTGLSDQWKRCLQPGVSLTGGDMEGRNSQGVNTIWDCWEWCLDTPGCQAVSFYEDARWCHLKDKSDGMVVSDTSYVSITLACMTSDSTGEIAF